MEDYSKTQSAQKTGATFANTGFSATSSNHATLTFQTKGLTKEEKLQIKKFVTCQEKFDEVQTVTSTLIIEFERIKQLNRDVLSSANTPEAQLQNLQAYKEVSVYNQQVQKQLQLKINQNLSKISQEVTELFKNRIEIQKKSQKQLKKEIEDLEYNKSKCLAQFSKNQQQKYADMKQRVAKLREQATSYQKQSSKFRQQIFGTLDSIRAKLNNQVSQQQSKRKSYNQIVQNLLEKSCGKAQKLLRRKI